MGRVADECHGEAEISTDPRRRLATVVGHDPADGDGADAQGSQPGGKVGRTVKRGVHVLRYEQIWLGVENVLEAVSGVARRQRRARLSRVMTNIDERGPSALQRPMRRAMLASSLGIVAPPPARLVEATLDVDHD